MPLFTFAKEILGIEFFPYEKYVITHIEKLNNKYGVNKWKVSYGRKGNARIINRRIN